MRVTRADIMFGLQRLLEIYQRPKHLPEDPGKLAEIYHRELDDLDVDVFRDGVSGYLKGNGRYFPRPGELRWAAREHARPRAPAADLRGDYFRWEQAGYTTVASGPFTPCPVCAAVVEFAPRTLVRHDHQVHLDRGVPYIGPRTGPCDDQGRMLRASATATERTA